MKNNNNEQKTFLQRIFDVFKSFLLFISDIFSSIFPTDTTEKNAAAEKVIQYPLQNLLPENSTRTKTASTAMLPSPSVSDQESVVTQAKNTHKKIENLSHRTAKLEKQTQIFSQNAKKLHEKQKKDSLIHILFPKK